MIYINRMYPSCYEELIRYYPRFYRDVREMVAILSAHGAMGDALYDSFDRVYSNNFIDEMDEYMISQLEAFLGLTAGSKSLSERRNMVKTYFVGFGKISATAIREIIAAYADVESEIVFEPLTDDEHPDHALYITVYEPEDGSIDTQEFFSVIKQRLPAHIWYVFSFLVQLHVESLTERAWLESVINTTNFCYEQELEPMRGVLEMTGKSAEYTERLDAYLSIENDLWYLNGDYLLNGERLLDAAITKEDL
ncbi:MAG: YmfQ family protein [Bacteroidales bacterium]|nr:YmfQ family protein [Bacteroidales bacterium]